jgi:hypothetical protein
MALNLVSPLAPTIAIVLYSVFRKSRLGPSPAHPKWDSVPIFDSEMTCHWRWAPLSPYTTGRVTVLQQDDYCE